MSNKTELVELATRAFLKKMCDEVHPTDVEVYSPGVEAALEVFVGEVLRLIPVGDAPANPYMYDPEGVDEDDVYGEIDKAVSRGWDRGAYLARSRIVNDVKRMIS